MEAAIIVVWSIGLVVALVIMLVILKEVALVIGTLRDIHRLALVTRDAARGVAKGTAASAELAPLAESAQKLEGAVASQASTIAAVGEKLAGRSGGAE